MADTVAYQKLEFGQEYAVVGTLMEKRTGKPLEKDGKPITSETVFRAEKEEGTVEVTDNGKIIIRGNGRQAEHLPCQY